MLMQIIISFNATEEEDISASGCVISGLVSGWTESYPDTTSDDPLNSFMYQQQDQNLAITHICMRIRLEVFLKIPKYW